MGRKLRTSGDGGYLWGGTRGNSKSHAKVPRLHHAVNCDPNLAFGWNAMRIRVGAAVEKGAHWAEPYKRSHYIGVLCDAVYDVNCDGWGTRAEWESVIAPWLGSDHKNWDGTWFARSCIVINEIPHNRAIDLGESL